MIQKMIVFYVKVHFGQTFNHEDSQMKTPIGQAINHRSSKDKNTYMQQNLLF